MTRPLIGITTYGRDAAGNELSSGIYLYRMESEGFEQTRKLLLLR